MKITKKFIALIAVMAVTLGLFSNIDDASATTSKDGYNITVSNIQVSPGQVDVGSLASLKFDFNIETQSGNAMKPGDTINLSTNIGTMFGSLPSSEIAIFSDNGQQIATAVVTGTEVKMEKKRIDWIGLLFGVIWFVASLIILIMYFTGSLNGSFSVPRIIAWVYDLLGVVPGALIQMVLSALLILFSVRRK